MSVPGNNYIIVIPARYASSRLPGKPLLEIAGKPLIQHVYESACNSRADSVCIATDDDRIRRVAESIGANVIMTLAGHVSGTDRIAEAIKLLDIPDSGIVVNLQADEIEMPAALLDQVADILIRNHDANMGTLCEPVEEEADIKDPNIVKVVFDRNNRALYFSRAPIPYNRVDGYSDYYRHIGLYAYRAGFLKELAQLTPCQLELAESLEQLRALYYGVNIFIEPACEPPGFGVDTEEDLQRARTALR